MNAFAKVVVKKFPAAVPRGKLRRSSSPNRARSLETMANSINKAGLEVAEVLVRFIEDQALPGTGIAPRVFWSGVADIYARFESENRALLAARDKIQVQIDAWHEARSGKPVDTLEYEAFLRSIGYLVDEP